MKSVYTLDDQLNEIERFHQNRDLEADKLLLSHDQQVFFAFILKFPFAIVQSISHRGKMICMGVATISLEAAQIRMV